MTKVFLDGEILDSVESPEEINEDIKNIWDAFDRTVLNYNDITGDTNA